MKLACPFENGQQGLKWCWDSSFNFACSYKLWENLYKINHIGAKLWGSKYEAFESLIGNLKDSGRSLR